MRIHSIGITDIGLKRRINQDAYLIDEDLRLYIVADGMGGHKGGEVASRMSVDIIKDYCRKNPDLPGPEALEQGINFACREIHQESLKSEELSGMGTTVVAMLIRDTTAYLAQVGDSRAYLLHDDHIWQVTEDHSLLNEEIRSGRLTAVQAENFQFKNVITRSVGYESHVVVDIYRRDLQQNDTFFLCTDGLSGYCDKKEIHSHVSNEGPDAGLRDLVDISKQRGGEDNITGVVVAILGD